MGHPNSLHFRELTWLLRNIFKHSISSQTCWDFLQHNHTLYCYLHLECELKMEQRHPVTQMALSFRDHSGLQTPVVSQQPGFYEKMPPSRVRVLGGSVLRAEVTFAALLSGVAVTAGLVMPPQSLSGQASYTLSSQPSPSSCPSSSTCSLPTLQFFHPLPWPLSGIKRT